MDYSSQNSTFFLNIDPLFTGISTETFKIQLENNLSIFSSLLPI